MAAGAYARVCCKYCDGQVVDVADECFSETDAESEGELECGDILAWMRRKAHTGHKYDLRLTELRASWEEVAVHAGLSLLIMFPVINVPVLAVFMYKYVFETGATTASAAEPGGQECEAGSHNACLTTKVKTANSDWTPMQRCLERGQWLFVLSTVVVSAVMQYHLYRVFFAGNIRLDLMLEVIQFETMLNACTVVGILLYRILSFHEKQVSEALKKQRGLANDENTTDEEFQGPRQLYRREDNEPHLQWHHYLGMTLSIALTVFGLLCTRFLFGWNEGYNCTTYLAAIQVVGKKRYELPRGTSWPWALLRIVIAGITWWRLLKRTILSYVRLRQSFQKTLLLMALTESHLKNFSVRHYRILAPYLAQLEVPGDDTHDLRERLEASLRDEHFLDLRKEEDLEDWWGYRRYLQFESTEDSLIMNHCCCVVAILVFQFVCACVLDWIAHKDPFAPGLVLALVMALQLAIILGFMIIECENINEAHLMDNHLLAKVEEEVCRTNVQCSPDLPSPSGRSAVSSMSTVASIPSMEPLEVKTHLILEKVRMMQHSLDFDSFQHIFGFKITRKVRNGWIASITCIFISFATPMVTSFLTSVDINDFSENLNVTSSNFTAAALGRWALNLTYGH